MTPLPWENQMTSPIQPRRPAVYPVVPRRVIVATLALTFLAFSLSSSAPIKAAEIAADSGRKSGEGKYMEVKEQFTGTILPVFYVKDVLRSVEFWRDSLGFECYDCYDHEAGGAAKEWTNDTAPYCVEMRAGPLVFALHLARNPDSLQVGGMIHYFEVPHVYQSHERLTSRGMDVSKIYERPWMNMFRIIDPDGHEIFFFTRPAGWDQ